MEIGRWFKVNREDREFIYLFGSREKAELQPFIKIVKEQGDMYRITKDKAGFHIWDARS